MKIGVFTRRERNLLAEGSFDAMINANYSNGVLLPDGSECHRTVRSVSWWAEMIQRIAVKHPQIYYSCSVLSRFPLQKSPGKFATKMELVEGIPPQVSTIK